MIAKIQVRNDTAANWTSANPTLLVGEVGYETDTKKKKMGDGVTAWNSLEYNMLQAGDLNDDDTVVKTTVDGVELFVGKSVVEMQNLLSLGYDIYSGDDFIAKYNAAASGAFLTVQPGSTFDFGSSSCILTNKSFNAEGCTFTSSASGGTFKDNGSTSIVSIRGFPSIINTNDTTPLTKRIILTNGGSIVNDFWWEYLGFISDNGDGTVTSIVLKNTLGGTLVWSSDISEFIMIGTLSNAFLEAKTIIFCTLNAPGGDELSIKAALLGNSALSVQTIGYVGNIGKCSIHIIRFP